MRTKLSCLVVNLVICTFSHTLFAQDAAPVKFGKMSIEDFDISKYPVDTSHGAVVIADVGYSSFEGNNDGWFTLVHKVHRRVKVISNKGFDIASIEIPLYVSKTGQNEERVEKLKAVTYNIENGKIVETKLSDDAVFKEKKNSFINLKKFTMPAIKPGCVFEYTYTINSDFLFNLQPWSFQGGYPRIWSEYTVEIPTFFEYVSILQGFREFDVKNSKTVSRLYRVRIPSTSAWEKMIW